MVDPRLLQRRDAAMRRLRRARVATVTGTGGLAAALVLVVAGPSSGHPARHPVTRAPAAPLPPLASAAALGLHPATSTPTAAAAAPSRAPTTSTPATTPAATSTVAAPVTPTVAAPAPAVVAAPAPAPAPAPVVSGGS